MMRTSILNITSFQPSLLNISYCMHFSTTVWIATASILFCFNNCIVGPVDAFVCFPIALPNSIRSYQSTGSIWTCRRSQKSLYLAKNWDKILSETDDEYENVKRSIPFDMRYNQRNCERAQQSFRAIREAGGKDVVADIYGLDRSLSNINQSQEGLFWYLGKVARVSDVTLEQCMSRQWHLIQQHAANLRPLDLYPAWTIQQLELWCAPGDSELDVAYNRPSITFVKMEANVSGADDIKNNLIGFQGEVYERGEEGFRTFRNVDDGTPSRPEITGRPVEEDEIVQNSADTAGRTNGPGEILDRPPTDEESERLKAMLEGQDINELYEEQERRRRAQNKM